MIQAHAFVMSGGSGTRLWPLSRRALPKQYLKLFDGFSLFQRTISRICDVGLHRFSVLGSSEHRFICRDQLTELRESPEYFVLEPFGRNTAPAAAISALLTARENLDDLVLLLPSDHIVNDEQAFRDALTVGAARASEGTIVTFAVVPDEPATGYGYIEVAEMDLDPLAPPRAVPVQRFTEKPTRELAEKFVSGGKHLWNAGIFLFSARAMLEAFAEHAPNILKSCENSLAGAADDLGFLRLDGDHFRSCPNISLDYAIMEKAGNIETVPLQGGWSDLGSFDAIWQTSGEKDRLGNLAIGDVTQIDSSNSLLYTDGPALAGVGLDDMAVVATKDVVLVMPRARSQDVRKLVDRLRSEGRAEVAAHPRVYRPWGWYEQLGVGERFQVKRIMVKPGAKLSLQSHMHRSEHWVVVTGTARVTVGGEERILTENESTYVPVGAVHRLENPGKIPVHMIEVQSGAYLGEDDIHRLEDIYAREGELPKA